MCRLLAVVLAVRGWQVVPVTDGVCTKSAWLVARQGG